MTRQLLRAQLAITNDSIRVFHSAGQTARKHLSYVQEAGFFKALPGYFTERAGVASYLLVYTVSGRGMLRYGGREMTVQPGQVFLIDCRQRQDYRQIGTDRWTFYWVHFNGGSCGDYWHAICQTASGQPGAPIDGADEGAFVDPIRQIIQFCAKPGLQTDILTAQLVSQLLTNVLLATGQLQSRSSGYRSAVQTVLDQFEKQPAKSFSLAELAGLVALNKQYLLRLFRRETGLTPLGYQQALRISRAKDLLRTTEQTVQQISEAVGMNSGNYFIRVFKRFEGLTPLAYRKRWNAEAGARPGERSG